MAIVFDSDAGTITGLSVGGLPDGIVDNGTMADGAINTSELAANAVSGAKIDDNAVNSEHIVAGSVDNAHLATGITASKLTGALPATTMPSSSIIGVQQAWMAGTQTIGTSEVDVTDGGTGLTITSTNTNASKFLIKSNIFVGGNTDVGCYFYLYVNLDGAGYTKLAAAHSNYGGGGQSTKNFMTYCAGDNDSWNLYTGSHASQEYLYTPTFSTSVAFKIRAKGYSGSHYIGRMANHNNSSSWSHAAPSSLTMYEIK
jgi:hypothetical protein